MGVYKLRTGEGEEGQVKRFTRFHGAARFERWQRSYFLVLFILVIIFSNHSVARSSPPKHIAVRQPPTTSLFSTQIRTSEEALASNRIDSTVASRGFGGCV